MTKKELLNKQNEIDERIKQIWGENCSLDGITDIDTYLRNEEENWHTLWILKEMNRDFRKDGILSQRQYLKEEAGWNMGTWGNIMRVTAGIREYAVHDGKPYYFDELPKLQMENGNKDFRYYDSDKGDRIFPLDEIAMINVHKGIGGKSSNDAFIATQYTRPEVRKLILDQVDYINPRLIIVCNHVNQLLCDLAGVEDTDYKKIYKREGETENCYYKTAQRLIISTGHPLFKDSKDYCNAIFDTVYGEGI